MTHPSNRQHLPPAKSAEEYERTIRGLREALVAMEWGPMGLICVYCCRFKENGHTEDCFVADALARYPQAPEAKP